MVLKTFVFAFLLYYVAHLRSQLVLLQVILIFLMVSPTVVRGIVISGEWFLFRQDFKLNPVIDCLDLVVTSWINALDPTSLIWRLTAIMTALDRAIQNEVSFVGVLWNHVCMFSSLVIEFDERLVTYKFIRAWTIAQTSCRDFFPD